VGNFSHRPAKQDRPQFLRNLGPRANFHFQDKSGRVGLRWKESFSSPALGDYDNDGHLDFFLLAVYGGDVGVLYRNYGDWTFTEITDGIVSQKSAQAAWADFDNDGDLDLLTGGKLYRNPGNDNHWLKVRLAGEGQRHSNVIGAQLRVAWNGQTLTRQVEAGTGPYNQNDMTLHVGLGNHSEPVSLEIRWPGGHNQELATPVDRLVVVRRTTP